MNKAFILILEGNVFVTVIIFKKKMSLKMWKKMLWQLNVLLWQLNGLFLLQNNLAFPF